MWGRLKGDMVTTLSSKISLLGFPSQSEDANEMWVNMEKTIRKVAKETLGVSSGKPKVFKELWWWNDEVEKKIKDKNKRFKELRACTEEEDRIENRVSYKEAKRAAKKTGPKEEDNQIFDAQRPLKYGSTSDLTTEEVREALKKMGRTKAVGPNNIPIEVWKGFKRRGYSLADKPL
ncbi:uncharacterized protein LOC130798841 [Amaranthus tricolor]|uniref:uncharacterized protein LOC130798841 n=1 Tax=Amaranthus tricolor TaxID=29722 RepID=UPI00258807F8|nr:uncharacterized protein LOC130798841 [Amaranthus tricolor]